MRSLRSKCVQPAALAVFGTRSMYGHEQQPYGYSQPQQQQQQHYYQQQQQPAYGYGAYQQQGQYPAYQQHHQHPAAQQQPTHQQQFYGEQAHQSSSSTSRGTAADKDEVSPAVTAALFVASIMLLTYSLSMTHLVDLEADIQHMKHIPLTLDLPDPKEQRERQKRGGSGADRRF